MNFRYITTYRRYLLIGLLLILFLLFEIVLVRQSPRFARGPIAAISLHNEQRTVFVVGNRLQCNQDNETATCQLPIEPAKVLTIQMQPPPQRWEDGFNSRVTCQATFQGQPFRCHLAAAGLIAMAPWPAVVIEDALPLNAATLARLHRQNFLLNVSEDTWFFPMYFLSGTDDIPFFNLIVWANVIGALLLLLKRTVFANTEEPKLGSQVLSIVWQLAFSASIVFVCQYIFLFQILYLAYAD